MAELAALLFGLMSECLFELRLGLLHIVLEVFFFLFYWIGVCWGGGGGKKDALRSFFVYASL